MNRIVLNRLTTRGGEDLSESDYAVLIDLVGTVERGELLTAHELAARNYVSPATVSRLCKKFGMGFREMRQYVADELDRVTHASAPLSSQYGARAAQLKSMLSDGIDQTLAQVSHDLDRAVDKIAAASSILVLGVGMSYTIADYFAMRLQAIGIRAATVRNDVPAGVFVNAANHADLIVVISRSGESSHVLAKAAIVRRLEKDMLVIGCKRTTTLGAYGNPCLPVFGSKQSLAESQQITSYSLCAFFLVDAIIDALLHEG